MDRDDPRTRTTAGYPPVYILCSMFFILAIVGIAVLMVTDFAHGLKTTLLHQRLDAWPLILIGLSYITLQLSKKQSAGDRLKGFMLGVAFLLWGGEQLLPPSRLVTFMDEGAVTIFVIDVSFIIWGHLNHPDDVSLP